jgi:hypothetical protein
MLRPRSGARPGAASPSLPLPPLVLRAAGSGPEIRRKTVQSKFRTPYYWRRSGTQPKSTVLKSARA